MPVTPLPPNPNLDHLKSQARDLLKAHASREPQAAQRIREFHPRFQQWTDAAIFDTRFRLSDAQFTIARERGFVSWARLKRRIEKPTRADSWIFPIMSASRTWPFVKQWISSIRATWSTCAPI